jgi:hypothetical protein
MTIAEVDVDERVLSSMTLNRPLKVADLTRREGLAAGVTAAVTAGPDYRDAQRLASELQGNADGVRWRLRYDLGQSLIGVALFGDAGSQPAASSLPTQTEAIPRELVREAEDAFGYRVAPLP